MINIYLYNNSSLSNAEQHLLKLPKLIQKRILRRKRKAKREVSLKGYLLLQHALKKNGLTLEEIFFLASGKPILKETPIHFNISHSGNLLGVSTSRKGAIGLDIEQFRRFENVETSFSFFSKVEQESILADSNPQHKLIELWSKKESLVKAVGGRMFDMAAYTDVRFSETIWQGNTYFFYPIQHDFDGYIWIASSFSTNNIVKIEPVNLW